MTKRKKRKQCRKAKRQVVSNEVAAHERLIEALRKVIFSFGSIFAVGEDLWQKVLPLEYGESGREMHPGLCIEPPNKTMIPATVMMLFGSHTFHRRWHAFIVQDPFGEGDLSPCNFGSFPPVGLDPTTYAKDDSEIRTHIRPYKGRIRMLSLDRHGELRQFLHDVYAWEEKS